VGVHLPYAEGLHHMITYQRYKPWHMAVAALAVASAAGGAYWFLGQSGDVQSGVVLADNKDSPPGWPQASTGVQADGMASAPTILSDGRPSDVQADDWSALNAALAKQSMPKTEAERIVGYLRFQHSFEAWQSLDETKDAKKRRAMAQALLAELPDRQAKGEFTAIEGTLMSTVLMADLEPDESKREKRLEELQAKLTANMAAEGDEQAQQAKARQTELKRRLATAYGEWQAKTTAAERTQAKLDQALEDVRRAYNSGEF